MGWESDAALWLRVKATSTLKLSREADAWPAPHEIKAERKIAAPQNSDVTFSAAVKATKQCCNDVTFSAAVNAR